MRLKKLEILGFKSFADKTKLEFHPGITAVVGPNGCGKSNIADAFRWVLGEQSAKSMRGSRMPDVIFAGTSHRKPLNFSEVTITLDGIDGTLPIDYDEVSITRRLHRSGESEYFINRHPVRLKDVHSLLLDSGMGKDAYSIFEQGKIDQVINLSPLERRYIFEEAAGIIRFLQRKKEALRKLEQTDLNVSRVKDIHTEVEKQIIVLELQAEDARLYMENKQELVELEKAVLFAKWTAIQKRLEEASTKSKLVDEEVAQATIQIDALLSEFAEAKQSLIISENAARARSEEVYQARSAKEIKSKEKENQKEQLKDLLAKEKRWQHELETMIERRLQRERERGALQTTQKKLEKQLAEVEIILKSQKIKASSFEKELAEKRRWQHTAQQDLLNHLKHESSCESNLKQIALRKENAEERKKELEERIEQLLTAEQELSSQVKEKKQLLETSSKTIDGYKDSFELMEVSLHELLDEIKKVEGQLDGIQLEHAEVRARHVALQRLREDMEGFSSGSKSLLNESRDKDSLLFNKIKGLYESIVPKKGAEANTAAIMKTYAETLVVETDADFDAVIAYANQHGLKDFSLLSLESVNRKAKSKEKTTAACKLPSFLTNVAENTLTNHFLKDTFVAKEMHHALQAVMDNCGIEAITESGAVVDRRSVVFYPTQGENNVFLREAEIKTIEKKLADFQSEKEKLEAVLKALQQKKNQLQAERIALDKTIRQSEMKLIEVNFAFQKLTADIEKSASEQKALKSELRQMSSAIEEHTIALNDLSSRYTQAKSKSLEAKNLSEMQHQQLEKQIADLQLEMDTLQEVETSYQQLAEDNRKQVHALHVLEVKDRESEQQEKRLEEEVEIGRHYQSQIVDKGGEVEKRLLEVEQSLSEVTAVCKELEQEVAVRKGAIEHLEGKINEKRTFVRKSEADCNQISILRAQLESSNQSVENELQERHGLTVEKAKEVCQELTRSLDQSEKQVRQLRQQIENAGAINMTSIEECDKHKERYQFLNQQIDDLEVSKQDLLSIITELDDESRKLFKATFDQIRTNFQKNFQILFNGGEADLQFTTSGDVLEAGIEIIAKPPGKQMRSISLLSGGEKCLTAVALLFAVFEVKPAPFCILDEIDAPLDDTNVQRFVNIVKEFVDRCQFIIITHNKRTMSIADVIFGVSMEERGVSKLLSMDFSSESVAEPVLVQ